MQWLNGLIDLPWWGYILVVLGFTHVTMAAVTIFLHRHQAHRALDLHPVVSHFFRFWLWMGTGMVTKQWAAIHRKHHARCETPEDPHSPWTYGIRTVLLQGAELYRKEAKNQETMDKFGHGTPDDWMERNVYTRYSAGGISILLVLAILLFGPNGIWMWAVAMVWTPFFAAGVINGLAHWWGYRNFECEDKSTNIFPWGILIAGEELHNNHHTFGTSAKLSYKWFEFDIGWMYIRILSLLGLATVRRTQPKMVDVPTKLEADHATLQALIANRYIIASRYARTLRETCAAELEKLAGAAKLPSGLSWGQMKRWLKQDAKDTPEGERATLQTILQQSRVLETVYQMRQELTTLWERSAMNSEQLLNRLRDWCQRAELSGIPSLQQFARQLQRMAVPAAA
ncbi:DesA family fatty acid desaturase [Leeia aquatica]|uniref:Acyl-CoA desaturase n=1 Tax=Leeia aquatica TaxID=2725557 RepID=A0A847RV65_9NEIS|nr:fatty acid desaturase [Leeia aquatica]NLR75080.1 acyl-CoA desaturase [Leeia aquatica]